MVEDLGPCCWAFETLRCSGLVAAPDPSTVRVPTSERISHPSHFPTRKFPRRLDVPTNPDLRLSGSVNP
eukprot:113435-Rhodomonas_salina.1